MLLRYRCLDYYPIPVKEEELLFNGTEADCHKYLLKEWAVDFFNTPGELISQAMHDINHIQVLNIDVKRNGKYIPVHELADMDIYDKIMGKSGWRDLDPVPYIFNRELISIE